MTYTGRTRNCGKSTFCNIRCTLINWVANQSCVNPTEKSSSRIKLFLVYSWMMYHEKNEKYQFKDKRKYLWIVINNIHFWAIIQIICHVLLRKPLKVYFISIWNKLSVFIVVFAVTFLTRNMAFRSFLCVDVHT